MTGPSTEVGRSRHSHHQRRFTHWPCLTLCCPLDKREIKIQLQHSIITQHSIPYNNHTTLAFLRIQLNFQPSRTPIPKTSPSNDVTITSYTSHVPYNAYVPSYVPPPHSISPAERRSPPRAIERRQEEEEYQPHSHLEFHLRKPGRKITNWPVDPALALYYQVEDENLDPEPCISFGGRKPPRSSRPDKTPPVRPSSVRSPTYGEKKKKKEKDKKKAAAARRPKPKKGHPLIVKVNPPTFDSSPDPSEAGTESSSTPSTTTRTRPVSRLPLWLREQKRKQEDASKQTKFWERQLLRSGRHQVHKKGSRTTL